jgi:beta-glucosidase
MRKTRNVTVKKYSLYFVSMISIAIFVGCNKVEQPSSAVAQPTKIITVKSQNGKILSADGLMFRDLNQDGQLNPYEDWRLGSELRAQNLVSLMTLEEKAGAMMHGNLPGKGAGAPWAGTSYDTDLFTLSLKQKNITSFITRLSLPPVQLATLHNELQAIAESHRLGIPVTISTDPRNHFQYVVGASSESAGFSKWPEPLGFAALRDVTAVKIFADIARQEYRSVGIHMALSPQADLATEPRWSRQAATFGSRADLVSEMAAAYVSGFQGSDAGVSRDGVIAVTKHWVGYGAAKDGFDGHNAYGKYAQLDDNTLVNHISAFEGPLKVKTAGIMPTYSIPQAAQIDGKNVEEVGAGFNADLLGHLRSKLGYQGMLLSDWGITNDCSAACSNPGQTAPQTPMDIAMPWGVESLARAERFVKGINAGLDQFGGVEEPNLIVDAVTSGSLTKDRIDQSVVRIMKTKFELGLFDDPYVDPSVAEKLVGSEASLLLAHKTQVEAQVLLENKNNLLPLAPEMKKIFISGVEPSVAEKKGFQVVAELKDADFALIRTETPHVTLHPYHFFGSHQDEGRLDFTEQDKTYALIQEASASVPTIVSIFMDRPAILTNIKDKAAVIIANFGVSDEALIDSISGQFQMKGKLPFELPSSMNAVEQQHPAIADDSKDPTFSYGYGLLIVSP